MSLIKRIYTGPLVRGRIFDGSIHDAEIAHEWGMKKLVAMQNSWWQRSLTKQFLVYKHPMLRTSFCGLDFPNPLGLSAGFDKYCQVYHTAIPACGWGSCEIGSITRHEQAGNDRPRMLRSAKNRSLLNAMGFNNPGAELAGRTMANNPTSLIPIGLSLGKSKITELDEATEDYVFTLRCLWPFTDFIVINPSSPNTPGIRELQQKDRLQELIAACKLANAESAEAYGRKIQPLGLKISPDESDEQLADIVSVCIAEEIDFIITTNTTTSREGCKGWYISPENKGGVSGQLLRKRSLGVQKEIYKALKGSDISIIGSGGVTDGKTMWERIINGANMCQALSAWPFEGPDFVKRSLKELMEILKHHGYENIQDAVGIAL